MLFPRHPKPVTPQKAVATQVVQQRVQGQGKAVNPHVLIVDEPAPVAPPPPAKD